MSIIKELLWLFLSVDSQQVCLLYYQLIFLHDICIFSCIGGRVFGKMWLFFGCRQRALDLYREEKAAMLKEGVLDEVYLALSREPTIPKVTEVVNNRVHIIMGC